MQKIQISSGAYGITVRYFAGVIRLRKGWSGLGGTRYPCATARNTEQALLAGELKGVTQTWLRDVLYFDRACPGQANSAQSLDTRKNKCIAPGYWQDCDVTDNTKQEVDLR